MDRAAADLYSRCTSRFNRHVILPHTRCVQLEGRSDTGVGRLKIMAKPLMLPNHSLPPDVVSNSPSRRRSLGQ